MRQRARSLLLVVVVVGAASRLTAQEPPPAVDRADPTAVARAYSEACRAGDVEGVLALLAPDDPAREGMKAATEWLGRGVRKDPTGILAETVEWLFAPVGIDVGFEVGETKVDGDLATVQLHRDWPVEQKVVLRRGDDGLWYVKPLASVKATTGQDATYLAGYSFAATGSDLGSVYDSEDRLRALQEAIDEYVREHDNHYPPAGTWMDVIEPYVLSAEAFKCPSAPYLACGYALNAEVAEQPVSEDWDTMDGLLLLFEWPTGERNASAMPDDLAKSKALRGDALIAVVNAVGNTSEVPEGWTWGAYRLAAEQDQQCEEHLTILAAAARSYTRDHDGLLPPVETWEDDLTAYLPAERDLDDLLRCPAAPNLSRAYAYNAEVAGKSARDLGDPGKVVLFFESALNVPNAGGSPANDGLPNQRHVGQWHSTPHNLVALLDGSVQGNEAAELMGTGMGLAGVQAMARGAWFGSWREDDRLRDLWYAASEYADEHDGHLPPAERWMDELELYVLDRDTFKNPDAPDLEYGYAMNVAAGGLRPQEQTDQNVLLFIEWPTGERNAVTTPDGVAQAKSPRGDGSVRYYMCDGGDGELPEGQTWAEAQAEVDPDHEADVFTWACQERFGLLAKAIRLYARRHAGILPAAGTWVDDILPIVGELREKDEGLRLGATPEATFACPAAPTLEFAYAINDAVAGKNALDLRGHDKIILLFESEANVRNAHGDPTKDAAKPRHTDGEDPVSLCAYLSGDVHAPPVPGAAEEER